MEEAGPDTTSQSKTKQTNETPRKFSSRPKAIVKVNGYPIDFDQLSVSKETDNEASNTTRPRSVTYIAHWTGPLYNVSKSVEPQQQQSSQRNPNVSQCVLGGKGPAKPVRPAVQTNKSKEEQNHQWSSVGGLGTQEQDKTQRLSGSNAVQEVLERKGQVTPVRVVAQTNVSKVEESHQLYLFGGMDSQEQDRTQRPSGSIDFKNIFEQKGPNTPVRPSSQANDLVTRFIQLLKKRYKEMYTSVQPVPYIRDRLYCVDRVYVEGGIIDLSSDRPNRLDSYQCILQYAVLHEVKRVVVIGDPGYGKTMLSLQFAYDWCERVQSCESITMDVLIVLSLRQLGGISSISQAIQRFALPSNSALSVADVESILESGKSVVIILDGFDEYPDFYLESNFVQMLISREMYENVLVILTGRFSPSCISEQTQKLKLSGFDETARDNYIKKAVVNDQGEAKKIILNLEQNKILQDLCEVPFLFVMFAHMSYEMEEFVNVKSVTTFFEHILACFHNHMKRKMEEENVQKCYMYEEEHGRLDKIAFDGLLKRPQQMVWTHDVLCDKLGQDFFDQYMKIGILVVNDHQGNFKDDLPQACTEIRFYHKLFQEWYAAFHFANCVKRSEDLSKITKNIRPSSEQYFYRFACGLADSVEADRIIQHLQYNQREPAFSLLCLAERIADYGNFQQRIEELCSNYIEFESGQSSLLQRSTLQLLNIASSKSIPIKKIILKKTFRMVLTPHTKILLRGGLHVPLLQSLEEIEIDEKGRKLSEEETISIIGYSFQCTHLKTLCFKNCLMPRKFTSIQHKRDIEVSWILRDSEEESFGLNLLTGTWEKNGQEMTTEKYKRQKFLFLKKKISQHDKRTSTLEEKKKMSLPLSTAGELSF